MSEDWTTVTKQFVYAPTFRDRFKHAWQILRAGTTVYAYSMSVKFTDELEVNAYVDDQILALIPDQPNEVGKYHLRRWRRNANSPWEMTWVVDDERGR